MCMPNPCLKVSTRGHPFWKKLIHLAVERGPANHIWQRWTGLHPIHLVVGVDLLSSANYLCTEAGVQRGRGRRAAAVAVCVVCVCVMGW